MGAQAEGIRFLGHNRKQRRAHGDSQVLARYQGVMTISAKKALTSSGGL